MLETAQGRIKVKPSGGSGTTRPPGKFVDMGSTAWAWATEAAVPCAKGKGRRSNNLMLAGRCIEKIRPFLELRHRSAEKDTETLYGRKKAL